MKKNFFTYFAFFICVSLQAQDYVDIVKLSSNNATLGNVDDNYETRVNNLNFELYYPSVINEKLVRAYTFSKIFLKIGQTLDSLVSTDT